jgi:lipid II:glycine glycyltransferase (peptidoglycan interpeptide bridge formation enzyme)
MRKNTRYEINRSQKLGIKITVSNNPQDIDGFYKLQLKTANFHQFVPFGINFLKTQFRQFATDNQVYLYSAYYKDTLLTQSYIIFYGQEADYHYSASTLAGRKYPGAYALQWAAIKEAKKRGMSRYNFWGVAPEGQTDHRFYGVSVFKRGFRGEDINYLHARDLVVDHLGYSLNWIVETIRRHLRKV